MANLGVLHLFPTPLSTDSGPLHVPQVQLEVMGDITHWIVETPKTARAQLRQMMPEVNLQGLLMTSIGKHENILPKDILKPCLNGEMMGLISDAGLPAIADPGHLLVSAAHQLGVPVKPWPGPNSMMMALMASGFNGQSFRFHGYLPHDSNAQKKQLQNMAQAASRGESQIWMETPYRNGKHLQELCQILPKSCFLSLACDITSQNEFILTQSVADWKRWATPTNLDSIHKRPAVWILGS